MKVDYRALQRSIVDGFINDVIHFVSPPCKLWITDGLETLLDPSIWVEFPVKRDHFVRAGIAVDDGLYSTEIPPEYYLDAYSFGVVAQLRAFYSKVTVVGAAKAQLREERAWEKFLENERTNAFTNRKIDLILSFPTSGDEPALEALETMRNWIKRVLGPIPSRLDGGFGKGSVYECDEWASGTSIDAYNKMVLQPSKSHNFSEALFGHMIEETAFGRCGGTDGFNFQNVVTVRGCRFSTVLKRRDIDRGITIQPGCNVFSQKAVGSYWKKRINAIGLRQTPSLGLPGAPYCDLHVDAKTVHMLLSRDGSFDGGYVTIDFSSASDLNAAVPVRYLLGEWSGLTDELRTTHTRFRGKWHKLEMYSAMGNGFTFEILTLLMAAAAHASGFKPGVDAFVFGDDVILKNEPGKVKLFLELTRLLGHKPNPKKTFLDGPFRESCGGDYLRGVNVRPIFMTDATLKDSLARVDFHNLLYLRWFGVEGVLGIDYPSETLGAIRRSLDSLYKCGGWNQGQVFGLAPKFRWNKDLQQNEQQRVVRVTTRRRLPLSRATEKLLLGLAALGIPLSGLASRGSPYKDLRDWAVPRKWSPSDGGLAE